MDEKYSFDYRQENNENGIKISKNDPNDTVFDPNDTVPETTSRTEKLLVFIKQNPEWSQKEYAAQMKVSVPTIKRLLSKLQKENIVHREGNNRKGKWMIS